MLLKSLVIRKLIQVKLVQVARSDWQEDIMA